MRAVVQRVRSSKITVDDQLVSEIGRGINVLVGIKDDDTWEDATYILNKIVNLRIFEDENEKLNLSVDDIDGEIHLISQFTLYGDTRKGRRPSFVSAMRPKEANELYLKMRDTLEESGYNVKIGQFGSHMMMDIVNDGPVTILIDSRRSF